jgi:heme exporter protein D
MRAESTMADQDARRAERRSAIVAVVGLLDLPIVALWAPTWNHLPIDAIIGPYGAPFAAVLLMAAACCAYAMAAAPHRVEAPWTGDRGEMAAAHRGRETVSWSSFADFAQMGGFASYVWSPYLMAFGALPWDAVLLMHCRRRGLDKCAGAGRSTARAARAVPVRRTARAHDRSGHRWWPDSRLACVARRGARGNQPGYASPSRARHRLKLE